MTPAHRQTGQSQTGRHKRKETLLRPPRYLSLRLHSRKRETATHFGPFKCLTDRLASSRRHVRRFAFPIPRSLISHSSPPPLQTKARFPLPPLYFNPPPLFFYRGPSISSSLLRLLLLRLSFPPCFIGFSSQDSP